MLYQRILVGTDGSASAALAVDRASVPDKSHRDAHCNVLIVRTT